jgi:putative endonuclease
MSRSPERAIAKKRAALKKGRIGERLALVSLVLRGYWIEARNYTAHQGEIDIIARRGRVIAFIEVKARDDYATTETAIDGRKLVRMGRAASHWLARHPWAQDYALRIDAIDIVPHRWPRHRPDIAPLDIGH